MKVLIFMAVIIVVAAIVVHLVRKSASVKQQPAPRPRQDPFQQEAPVSGDVRSMRIEDMITMLGVDYVVRGIVNYVQGPFRWKEYYLDDGGSNKCWLSEEEDPDLEVVMWTDLGPSPDLMPGTKTILVGGETYVRGERETVSYTTQGTTGLGSLGEVEYIDYHHKDGRKLSFELWAGTSTWEMSSGMVIDHRSLEIYTKPVPGPAA